MTKLRDGFGRILAVVAVAGAIAATLVAAGKVPAAQAADGQQFYAMHWNIAGATTHDGDPNQPNNFGSWPVVEHLADLAAVWHPAVISVNEACDEQVDALRDYLEDRGLHVQAVAFSGTTSLNPGPIPDGPNLACLNSFGYYAGVALLSLVPASDPENFWFDPDTDQIVYHRTERAGACLTLHLSRDVRACTMHLAEYDRDNNVHAPRQAQAFADHFHDQIAAYPFMALGDFNSTPDQLLPSMYDSSVGGSGQFYEADMDAPNLGTPTEGSHKLDYVFASRNSFDRGQLALALMDKGICQVPNITQFPWGVLYPHTCSDHAPIVASLTLGSPGGEGGGEGFPPQPQPTDLPPTVNAGPDTVGVEGAAVHLTGSASDREETPTVSWNYYLPVRPVEDGVTCSFSDPHALATTFSCTDNGTFYVTLTADDGVNPPVSDALMVTLSNAPPVLRLVNPQPWQVYRAGTEVALDAPFTDAGSNDTHSCTVAWDDGSTENYPAVAGRCDRTHTYAHPGMYTITTTVTDDDDGTDSKTVLIVAYDPDAGFVTSGAHIDSPAGALRADPSQTGDGYFQFNPQYQPGDTGPVPGGGKVSFKLDGSGFDLDATTLEWLVVTPDGKAAVKGTATVAGQPGYGFVLYGYDTDPDSLRLVCWPLSAGAIPGTDTVYDNRESAGYDLDEANPQPVAGGSLNVHQ